MPEVNIRRRETTGLPWWLWVIGAILLALVIWWIVDASLPERELEAVAPTERVAGYQEEISGAAAGEALPLAAVVANPSNYFNEEVKGIATVGEVLADRAFWVEEGGERMFVVLVEGIPEAGINIEKGQRVFIHGIVTDEDRLDRAGGVAELQPQARSVIRDQQAFIRAMAVDILRPRARR